MKLGYLWYCELNTQFEYALQYVLFKTACFFILFSENETDILCANLWPYRTYRFTVIKAEKL